jgi:hypothetical protein
MIFPSGRWLLGTLGARRQAGKPWLLHANPFIAGENICTLLYARPKKTKDLLWAPIVHRIGQSSGAVCLEALAFRSGCLPCDSRGGSLRACKPSSAATIAQLAFQP